jgi:undecaprenyl phosphate N,N'-diacetylbacillosamine 1-phosphate transferase
MKRKKTFYEVILKRPFDFMVSIFALIVLSPVLVVIMILVKLKLGSPIIFKQLRPGLNEKVFNLYKFRTMTNEKDDKGNLLSDDERITKFGKFLRSSSLDELPSLINILKGELSIVGPRPQLIKDLWFMTNEERRRHLVRPGLTGLAQVSGRNVISWNKKFEYDLKYIQKVTFIKDVTIILKTVIKVIKRTDISQEGMETGQDLGEYLLNRNLITTETYDHVIKINNLDHDKFRKDYT